MTTNKLVLQFDTPEALVKMGNAIIGVSKDLHISLPEQVTICLDSYSLLLDIIRIRDDLIHDGMQPTVNEHLRIKDAIANDKLAVRRHLNGSDEVQLQGTTVYISESLYNTLCYRDNREKVLATLVAIDDRDESVTPALFELVYSYYSMGLLKSTFVDKPYIIKDDYIWVNHLLLNSILRAINIGNKSNWFDAIDLLQTAYMRHPRFLTAQYGLFTSVKAPNISYDLLFSPNDFITTHMLDNGSSSLITNGYVSVYSERVDFIINHSKGHVLYCNDSLGRIKNLLPSTGEQHASTATERR